MFGNTFDYRSYNSLVPMLQDFPFHVTAWPRRGGLCRCAREDASPRLRFFAQERLEVLFQNMTNERRTSDFHFVVDEFAKSGNKICILLIKKINYSCYTWIGSRPSWHASELTTSGDSTSFLFNARRMNFNAIRLSSSASEGLLRSSMNVS